MEKISLDKKEALTLIMDETSIIIDARTEEEVEEVPAISEDCVMLPFNEEFLKIIEEEEISKETKILIYSMNGVTSMRAVELLRANGYSAFNLEGGIAAIFEDNC
ncbi:MAG: rhodanese-like domain-containing protein [Fusobacteriaceae bacterium]